MPVTALQDISTDIVDITTDPSGGGGGGGGPFIKADGSIQLTSNWNAGPFTITSQNSEDCIYAGAAPYNVVANGSLTVPGTGTDQTANVTAAVAAGITAGKTVKFPSGVIRLDSTLVVPDLPPITKNVHITWEGTGSPSALSQAAAGAAQVGGTIFQFWTGAGVHGVSFIPTNALAIFTIRDMEFRGPDSDVTATSGDGLHLTGTVGPQAIRVDFHNVSVNHFRGGKGYNLQVCENGSGTNVSAAYNDVGFSFGANTNANNFYNLASQQNASRAVEMKDCDEVNIFGGLIQDNLKTGVYINGVRNCGLRGVHYESNNSSNTAGEYAVNITGTVGHDNSYVKIADSWFIGPRDILFLDGVGGAVTFATTIDTCRFQVVGPTINSAGVLNTLLINSNAGVLTDNGLKTNIVSDINGDMGFIGRIGAGTKTPTAAIELGAAGDSRIKFSGNGTLSGVGGPEITNAAGIGISMQSAAYEFNAANGSTNYVTMTAGPALGVGTASPTRTFDLNGVQRIRGIAAPAVSEIDSATLYYDSALDQTRISQNGSAYVNLLGSAGLTGAGVLNRVALWDAPTDVSSSANLTFDTGTNTLGLTGNFNLTGNLNFAVATNIVEIGGVPVFSTQPTLGTGTLQVGGLNAAAPGAISTAIGVNALNLSTGNRNTAVGFSALDATTNGIQNVAVGTTAGVTNVTGSNLVLIGDGTDVSAGNLNNAIAIGAGVTVAQSDSMQLGNSAMRVGVRTGGTPKTALDVGGSFALRQSGVALVNGLNSNIAVTDFGYIRLTGPTAAFSLGGFTGGTDGRMLFLYNTVAFQMTIVNEDASSSANNRIKTLTGGNVVLRAGTSAVILFYDTTDNRWIMFPVN